MSLLFFLAFGLPGLCAGLPAQIRSLDQVQEPPRFSSLDQWLGRAHELRQRIRIASGLWPLPDRDSLPAQLSEPLRQPGYSVRSVVLETFPGFFLTGNLFEPLGKTGPFPAVLSPHGHWQGGRQEDSDLASVPGRAINLARQDYVVLNYSMIGYNETRDLFPHRFDEPAYQLWGMSVAGLQLWNSLRALDFLESLPQVDRQRIGMTGASGGGTQTYMLAGIDPRISVSAPVNMISAHFQGGCICENPPLLRLETNNVELGALTAPHPLLMVSTRGDWTAATPHLEFPAIQDIYRLFGQPERVANVHLPYPHNYNRDSRQAVYAWFSQWLLKENELVPEEEFTVPEAARMEARLPSAPASPAQLFAHFKKKAQSQIEAASPRDWGSLDSYRSSFLPVLRQSLHPGLFPISPRVRTVNPPDRSGKSPAVLLTHSPQPASRQRAEAMAARYQKEGWITLLLESSLPILSSGEEPRYWTTYNPTPASVQVNEIRKAAEAALERPDVSSLHLIALDQTGWAALLARALVARIENTTIECSAADPTADAFFLENLYIPLLRRAGDFRTAAAAIAPRPLKLVGLAESPLKEWFVQVYAAAGASSQLSFSARLE